MNQKFNKGDHVRVADDLGPSMRHFQSGCEAIVIGSYADQYGGGSDRRNQTYTLLIKGSGQSSWYDEHQLTLIKASQHGLLERWEREKAAEVAERSDPDWIWTHGPEAIKQRHGATIEALGKDLGIDNLWGSHGEGITWMMNALAVMAHAEPFLAMNDRSGWLVHCQRAASSAGEQE